ncbi:MAG: hypothetical protein KF749_01725 [Bacteroidetes bacterium]|nr:hypothetical protein [Bacteroidota bacterium]MCW5896232.1 hypothetical protein [Bacteroidota bacterium]
MQLRYKFLLAVLSLSLFGFLTNISGDTGGPILFKIADDSDRNYTTVGNIGLTITNFGTIGTRNAYWSEGQPSCEYPVGSRIEHLYQGGLWVGAEIKSPNPARDGLRAVSTGSSNTVSTVTGRGFEFVSIPGTSIIQRSSLSESRYFDTSAISHQDFIGWYTDTTPRDSSEPDRPVPLGITVRQESYAWNFPFADAFVVLNYTIYNTGLDTLDSVYVGLWDNAVVRNTNNVRPGTAGYFERGANGYADTLRMKYSFDFDGVPTPPAAGSYIGIKLLGMTPFPIGVDSLGNLGPKTYYNAWRFSTTAAGDPAYFSPLLDFGTVAGERSRYDRMSASLPPDRIAPLRTRADNMTTLLTTGPFHSLLPGDSLQVVFGVICARKFGPDAANLDTREQRRTLYTNAGFAQQAYDGEDVNGNNILDPGEDLNGNGILDHFILPQPPRSPKVKAVVESQKVTIYWDKSTAELSVNPITRRQDFEGYRIYRSNPGADFIDPTNVLLNLTLVGEFDRPDNTIGYNTGFSRILLPQAQRFPGDTVDYWYRFPPTGESIPHLNGWQYIYGVASYSQGDSALSLPSLQSRTEIRRVIPGTDTVDVANLKIGVYPNPYYANAYWDGGTERSRKIYFYNLPPRCEIKIYTLAGDVVANLQHEGATYDGGTMEWFQRFGSTQTPIQFSGGEHAWDLITKFDQAIASGLYLFTVRNSDTGDVKTGKFLVIK